MLRFLLFLLLRPLVYHSLLQLLQESLEVHPEVPLVLHPPLSQFPIQIDHGSMAEGVLSQAFLSQEDSFFLLALDDGGEAVLLEDIPAVGAVHVYAAVYDVEESAGHLGTVQKEVPNLPVQLAGNGILELVVQTDCVSQKYD